MLPVFVLLAGQAIPGGTQPGALRPPVDPSSACSNCHYDYVPGAVYEPGQSYAATAMALSARDPFFRAAYVIAERDRPQLASLCVRCHVPAGWLAGRTTMSQVVERDLDGVGCDVCHRQIVEDPPLIGDARVTLAANSAKRSARGTRTGAHGTVRTDDVRSSEACGACHSLFNPIESFHDSEGRNLGFNYYEQRTYEEWVSSVFPGQGEGCVECHMSRVRGASALNGTPQDDLHVHDMVGGNDILARAVSVLEPGLGIGGLVPSLQRTVEANLAAAVDLEAVESGPLGAVSAEPFELAVRLTNRTGHKLPTGYPEGRRVYLEVGWVTPGQDDAEVVIGQWDADTGDLIEHPQLVKYETIHGRVENGAPTGPTQHLLLMNQILVDTRIPPEGFVPVFEDMIPVGRDFGAVAPYRHYDEPRFTLTAPESGRGFMRAVVRVRAMYQVQHGRAVDFLIENTRGTPEGEALSRAWRAVQKAPPKEMARVEIEVMVAPPPPPPPMDAGVADAGAPERPVTGPADGGCAGTGAQSGLAVLAWLVMLLSGLGRRWFRSAV